MWQVILDEIWGANRYWKTVRDDDIDDMQNFLRENLRGNPKDYYVKRTEGLISISVRSTGNKVMELRRIE